VSVNGEVKLIAGNGFTIYDSDPPVFFGGSDGFVLTLSERLFERTVKDL
jgi:hypothetical protein